MEGESQELEIVHRTFPSCCRNLIPVSATQLVNEVEGGDKGTRAPSLNPSLHPPTNPFLTSSSPTAHPPSSFRTPEKRATRANPIQGQMKGTMEPSSGIPHLSLTEEETIISSFYSQEKNIRYYLNPLFPHPSDSQESILTKGLMFTCREILVIANTCFSNHIISRKSKRQFFFHIKGLSDLTSRAPSAVHQELIKQLRVLVETVTAYQTRLQDFLNNSNQNQNQNQNDPGTSLFKLCTELCKRCNFLIYLCSKLGDRLRQPLKRPSSTTSALPTSSAPTHLSVPVSLPDVELSPSDVVTLEGEIMNEDQSKRMCSTYDRGNDSPLGINSSDDILPRLFDMEMTSSTLGFDMQPTETFFDHFNSSEQTEMMDPFSSSLPAQENTQREEIPSQQDPTIHVNQQIIQSSADESQQQSENLSLNALLDIILSFDDEKEGEVGPISLLSPSKRDNHHFDPLVEEHVNEMVAEKDNEQIEEHTKMVSLEEEEMEVFLGMI